MYCVYLLESKAKKKSYIGLTIKDPKVRTLEHNKGKGRYTESFKPWKLVYYENFYCKLCAEKREKYFKSGKEYRLRKLILNNREEL